MQTARSVSGTTELVLGSALLAFGQGVLSVLLAVHLQGQGLSLTAVGRVLSAGVLGGGMYLLVLVLGGAGIARRSWLVGLSAIAAACVVGISTLRTDSALLACALFGVLSGTTAAGPWQPLEQAILASATDPKQAPRAFARYRLTLSLAAAFGSLAAALPSSAAAWLGVVEPRLQRGMLLLVAGIFVLSALCFARIPHDPHDPNHAPKRTFENPLSTPSRGVILRLSGLFGVDHLGSSLANASLVTLWFHQRHDLPLQAVSALLAATFVLNAVSMWLSGRIAWRLGLIETMVFTHVPACVLLIVAAFAPSASLAVAAWLLRALLSNMDVPPRDAFTMAAVAPQERVTMASAQLLSRSALGAPGPWLATWLWQSVGPAAPFALGGALKIAYDLSLYALFKNHPASRPERDQSNA